MLRLQNNAIAENKTGCCDVAGNRTPISTTVPNCTASQDFGGNKNFAETIL